MGLESLQSLNLWIPYLPSYRNTPMAAATFSLLPFNSESRKKDCRVSRRSPLYGLCSYPRSFGLKRSCSANLNECFDEEFSKKIEDSARHVRVTGSSDAAFAVSEAPREERNNPFFSFLPSKLELLEPNFLGIEPEPPDWPERDELVRIGIEHKANSVDIPLSLRMIKRKQKWQVGFMDAGDLASCSLKLAFSSMVFMIRELQSHALNIRETLSSEDLQGVMNNVHMEMNSCFVRLFQQVFSRTPTLMIYLMLLLANFTVHSMVGNTHVMASPSPRIMDCSVLTTEEMNQEQDHRVGHISRKDKVGRNRARSQERDMLLGRLSTSIDHHTIVPLQIGEVSLPENQELHREEEVKLWDLMVEEASRMQTESRYTLDDETRKQLLSSLSVEVESDDYAEYHRTDLIYQMGVAEDPNNPLLLLNYAQFLFTVSHDHDRAEECFKRAILAGTPDAEVLSRYADFLWIVRKDSWGAEEKYQQAMAVEPNNHYHASKYANFLWNTGGEDTCFPLQASNDNYNPPL
ncbi:hypothetical protein K2173_005014 [Erythroxylum novogranatense]|uniref:Tetratricopeptide repeat-like superfamily protein n=1 Tax=Erythroxylum novogranatense TaxID=1862640 RepID=A0AAV8TCU6_9ROSI|nr:hypothetical protein K2173_005014 [Erythroxylum novogranatense]